MSSKQLIFVIHTDNNNSIKNNEDKELTSENSIKNKNDIIFTEQKDSFSDFNLQLKDEDDSSFKSDEELSLLNELYPENNLDMIWDNINNDNYNYKYNNDINNILNDYEYFNKIPFKKNRNNLNNNLIKEEIKDINQNKNNNNIRCDSLLIKFKSTIGKWFIKRINNKIKQLKENSIIKRKIKIYSFNYKKFTLKVTYSQNKEWLKYKMKDLLLLGDEDNQIKNDKSINIIYKKNELNEIKVLLELNYENIIQDFYLSDEFNKLKNNDKIKELNNHFMKIMKISLLENNGFIQFYETRRGNNTKNRDN